MCSGVSSITQQLAELMSQARSQRQQGDNQGGLNGRRSVSGTEQGLRWAGAAGAGGAYRRDLVLCFCSGASWGTPSKEGTGPRFAKQRWPRKKMQAKSDPKIPKWGASRNRKYGEVLKAMQVHLLSWSSRCCGHTPNERFKDGVYWGTVPGALFPACSEGHEQLGLPCCIRRSLDTRGQTESGLILTSH